MSWQVAINRVTLLLRMIRGFVLIILCRQKPLLPLLFGTSRFQLSVISVNRQVKLTSLITLFELLQILNHHNHSAPWEKTAVILSLLFETSSLCIAYATPFSKEDVYIQ